MFNPLHNITNQELFEKHLNSAIKVATMKNMEDIHFKGNASHATAKTTPFACAVSKEEWDTKEDTVSP